jgi:hypothetical protein
MDLGKWTRKWRQGDIGTGAVKAVKVWVVEVKKCGRVFYMQVGRIYMYILSLDLRRRRCVLMIYNRCYS